MQPQDLLQLARDAALQFVDLRHIDAAGTPRHHTLPVDHFVARMQADAGATFAADGTALRPDPATAWIDPFCQHPTLAVLCDTVEPRSGAPCADDLRSIARRAAATLERDETLGDVTFAPRLEFFIFDQASFASGMHGAAYKIDSREGIWQRGHDQSDNLGQQIAPGTGAAQQLPVDTLHNLRAEIVAVLTAANVVVEQHARGPATAGHGAIQLGPAPLRAAADAVQLARYVVRNVAARHGKVATFMPRPLAGEAGCGMPTRVTFTPNTKKSPAPESLERAITQHLAALCALTRPTTNSYRVPDAAPTATCSEPTGPDATPGFVCDAIDAASVSYVSLSALACLLRTIDASAPAAAPADPPPTFAAALDALAADRAWLLADEVFTAAQLDGFIAAGRAAIAAVQARPHPYEFDLYFTA
jgi:glutamine synthetase